jgi:anti-sigma regulatory factor (Ser/Thr protein kinase)
MPEPDLHQLLIAAGEACTNAVEHSGAVAVAGRSAAWIEATGDEAGVRVVIRDRGSWKQPDPAPDPLGRRGRGRMMMNHLVDHLRIESGPNGTTVELLMDRRGW